MECAPCWEYVKIRTFLRVCPATGQRTDRTAKRVALKQRVRPRRVRVRRDRDRASSPDGRDGSPGNKASVQNKLNLNIQ